MVACAGVGELSEAEDGLFGNPDVGRPGEGTVVLGRPIRFGLGDVKAKRNGDRKTGRGERKRETKKKEKERGTGREKV